MSVALKSAASALEAQVKVFRLLPESGLAFASDEALREIITSADSSIDHLFQDAAEAEPKERAK